MCQGIHWGVGDVVPVKKIATASPARFEMRPILAGMLASLILSVVLALLLALAVLIAGVGEVAAFWSLRVGGLLAIAVGGAVSAKKAQGRGLLHGASAGFLYMLVCVLLTMVLPGTDQLPFLRSLAMGVVIGGIGGIIGVNL